jgi:hypothetical protein
MSTTLGGDTFGRLTFRLQRRSTALRRPDAVRRIAQCTPSSYRRVTRWEHEAVLEAMQRRLDPKPEAMTVRRRMIEHVFGTLKHWMGSIHFLTRGLQHVSAEMNLHALAYNLNRLITLLDIAKTIGAMRLASA